MNHIIRTLIIFFLIITNSWADDLEIKVNQKTIKLPYWPATEPHFGAVLIIRGGEPVEWSDALANMAQLLAKNGWSAVLLNCTPEDAAGQGAPAPGTPAPGAPGAAAPGKAALGKAATGTTAPAAPAPAKAAADAKPGAEAPGAPAPAGTAPPPPPPPKWLAQLPEAMAALRQNKNNLIILIHYGEQLEASLDYFTKPQAKMVNALVMLSAYDAIDPVTLPQNLRFPVLDIYGQFDYDPVLNQVAEREKMYLPPDYRSFEMPGADHSYDYDQSFLVAFMSGWMRKLPEPEMAAPPPIGKKSSYLEPVYSLQADFLALQ